MSVYDQSRLIFPSFSKQNMKFLWILLLVMSSAVNPKTIDCTKCHEHGVRVMCGLDGRNYPNECYMLCLKVGMKCKGTCPCRLNKPRSYHNCIRKCPKEEECNFFGGCKKYDKWAPVCGSNDETYTNDCLRKCAGVKHTYCDHECPCYFRGHVED